MRWFSAFLLTLFLVGCGNDAKNHVHWDRDMCERCKMVVSDRHHTVKMHIPNSQKYYVFDDIGCFVLWQQRAKEPWGDQQTVLINDARSGAWIDMRKAVYTAHNTTPMGYGFSAYEKGNEPKNEETIEYAEVKKRVIKVGR